MNYKLIEGRGNCMVEDKNWMKLSWGQIYGVFIYDILLLIIGFILSIFIILNQSSTNLNILTLTLIGSIGTCLLGSSIYYIRKMYKSCIQVKIDTPDKTNRDTLQMIGTLTYYIIRPIFGIVFVILFVIGIKAGVVSMTSGESTLNSSFINLCMFLSFFIGFSTGKFIKALENYGQKIVDKIFKTGVETNE